MNLSFWKHDIKKGIYLLIGDSLNTQTKKREYLYRPLYKCDYEFFTKEKDKFLDGKFIPITTYKELLFAIEEMPFEKDDLLNELLDDLKKSVKKGKEEKYRLNFKDVKINCIL